MGLLVYDKFTKANSSVGKLMNASDIEWDALPTGSLGDAVYGTVARSNSKLYFTQSSYQATDKPIAATGIPVGFVAMTFNVDYGTTDQKIYFTKTGGAEDQYTINYQGTTAVGQLKDIANTNTTVLFRKLENGQLLFLACSSGTGGGEPDPATSSTIGGITVKADETDNTDTKVYTQIESNTNFGYATLKSADNAHAGVVKLSDSSTITGDIQSQNNTKAVTPGALVTHIGTGITDAVDARIKFLTSTQYAALVDASTVDPNVLYFITY